MFSHEDVYREFARQSQEIIARLNANVLELRQYDGDAFGKTVIVHGLLQDIHTLNGSAGLVGAKKLRVVTSKLHGLVGWLRKNPNSLSSEIIEVLFDGFDLSGKILQDANPGHDLDIAIEDLVKWVDAILDRQK